MTYSGRRPGLDAALDDARRRATTGEDAGSWPHLLAVDLQSLDATWQESAEICADVAWAARAAHRGMPLQMPPEAITRRGRDEVTARTFRHLYLSGLRYDFRCRAIAALLDAAPYGLRSQDPYTHALYAFALLGQSKRSGLDLMEEVLTAAGDHPKTLHVLLHGLWLGYDLPQRAEQILTLLDRAPFASRTDPIALFREAGALRSLGRYRAALDAIDTALELLPPGDPAVHADFVRERALIAAASDISRHIADGAEGAAA